MNPPSKPVDPRVQAALQDYLERIDRGELVDRDQFLADHGEIAEELRSFIQTSEELAGLAAAPASPPDHSAPDRSVDVSTHSLAERNQETAAPHRVQSARSREDLPPNFGRYRILKPLGSGAMGTVYLAQDTHLERQVALKTSSFDDDPTGELLERFYREAKAAALLRNPNICPVYDVGEIEGRHYISMAYIAGRPLAAFVQQEKRQPERQILMVVRKLALALQEAHDHQIIHRDLKPANVMIDQRGEPIIMDFGLARKIYHEDELRLTQSGMLVGSPAYMSPEQVEGEPDKLTPATDQYSLGVILFELLTGRLPFRGSITAVISQIVTREPPRPSEFRPDVSPRVEALCLKMLSKSAGDRFASMKGVADEIASLIRDPAGRATASATALGTSTLGGGGPVPREAAVAGIGKPAIGEAVRRIGPSRGGPHRKSRGAAAASWWRGGTIPRWGLAAGGAALAIVLAAVVLLLQTGDAIVRVTINDPQITVSVDGETLSIDGTHDPLTIDPGEKSLTITYGALEFQSTSFTLRKGDNPAVVVELLDDTLAARFGDSVIGNWPVDAAAAVTEASAAAASGSNPRLSPLDALNTPGWDAFAWVSPDGLRIYWEATAADGNHNDIWTAERAAPTAQFTMKRKLLPGRMPALSSDETEIVFVASAHTGRKTLYTAKRQKRSDSFGPPREIVLESYTDFNSPWISADGLRLYVNRKQGNTYQCIVASRNTRDAPWSSPTPLDVEWDAAVQQAPLSWVSLSADERTMLATHELDVGQWRVMRFERPSRFGRFTPAGYLAIPGVGTVYGRAPRYVPATRELFLSAPADYASTRTLSGWQSGNRSDLWVIRNVDWQAMSGQPTVGQDLPGVELSNAAPTTGVVPAESNVPAGGEWTELFNGRDLTGWDVMVSSGPTSSNQGGHTRSSGGWNVDPAVGVLTVATDTPGWLKTQQQYGDFELQVEFNLPAGGNSGVYVRTPEQGHSSKAGMEIQIIDKSLVDRSGSTTFATGSIQYAAPAIADAMRSAGQWNSLLVRCAGDDVRVTLNGVVVCQTNMAANETLSNRPRRGYIGLANWTGIARGTRFRNIRIRSVTPPTKSAAAAPTAMPAAPPVTPPPAAPPVTPVVVVESPWTSLFNGRDLTGWRPAGDAKGVGVVGGVIGLAAAKGGWLATLDNHFKDFELELEYRLSFAANSGVFLRIPDDGAASGSDFLEVQLIDDAAPLYRNIEDWKKSGAVFGVQGPTRRVPTAAGEWHTLRIRADGPIITVTLDGQQVNEVNLDTAPVLSSPPPPHHLRRRSGRIGLQRHFGDSMFRNIRIRELGVATTTAPALPPGTIDLLAVVEFPRDLLRGAWKKEGGSIVSPAAGGLALPRIQIPFTPPDEYRLTLAADRNEADALEVGLLVGGRQVLAVLDAFPKLGGRRGLQLVDGEDILKNTTGQTGLVLKAGTNAIVCTVRRAAIVGQYEVTVTVNGESAIRWSGRPEELSNHEQWSVPNVRQLFLGGSAAVYRISRITLQPLSETPQSFPPAP